MYGKITIVFLLLIIAVGSVPVYEHWQKQGFGTPIEVVTEIVLVPSPPKIIYKEAEVVEVIVEKEVGVIKEVLVKVPDYELRFFKNKTELLKWLNKNWVEDMGEYECIPEALELQRRAFRDGYQMSTEALFDGRREFDEDWHMVNSTVIGKDVIFIEPVDEYIWRGGVSGSQQ